ncbi:uncharacterized protein BDV14DRAFT_82254 [Aspergillus stella-maris]|uniref:uncharacterized protein n=1 Tax=Aspergillus stella-maris TaxID=1810926 RepID=UPI003CCC90FC
MDNRVCVAIMMKIPSFRLKQVFREHLGTLKFLPRAILLQRGPVQEGVHDSSLLGPPGWREEQRASVAADDPTCDWHGASAVGERAAFRDDLGDDSLAVEQDPGLGPEVQSRHLSIFGKISILHRSAPFFPFHFPRRNGGTLGHFHAPDDDLDHLSIIMQVHRDSSQVIALTEKGT